MMASARGTPRPVRIYVPSPELHTTVVRGVGFRATFKDGTKGPTRKTYAEARADGIRSPGGASPGPLPMN